MIHFSHPTVNQMVKDNKTAGGSTIHSGRRPYFGPDGSLRIGVNPNDIKWGYNLNTVTYPTYGGEVVQILSANIGDLTVGGDIPTYAMLEDIYLWFLIYMSVSTQGHRSVKRPEDWYAKYNEDPVTMWYPERRWMFKLKPKNLPGFKLGTEVVAPEWRMEAAVVQSDRDAEEFTVANAEEVVGTLNAGIGYLPDNPFSQPVRNTGNVAPNSDYQATADYMVKVFKDWGERLFETVDPTWSGPDLEPPPEPDDGEEEEGTEGGVKPPK